MMGGFSGCSGILVYDTSKEGSNGVYGYYEEGEMVLLEGDYKELKKMQSEKEKPFKRTDKKEEKIMGLLLLLMAAFVVLIFFMCSLSLALGALVFAAAAYMPLLVLCFANIGSYGNEEMQRQFRRYHGCEHALLNYYAKSRYKKNKEWTLDGLKKVSIYDGECGTVYSGYLLFLLAVLACLLLNLGSLGLLKGAGIFVAVVAALFLNIFNPLNPFKLLQRPAIQQPTDKEYLLGLAIIEKFKQLTEEEKDKKSERMDPV